MSDGDDLRSATQARCCAAADLGVLLDDRLFKALCDPTRIEIVVRLTCHGRADLGTLAAEMPQDASVVSRHLAQLHDAGIVRREKSGRHAFFEIDGPGVLARFEGLVEALRTVVAVCCPPASPAAKVARGRRARPSPNAAAGLRRT